MATRRYITGAMIEAGSLPTSPRAPHRVLRPYYDRPQEKPRFVNELFDRTAIHYDRINAVAFLGSGGWYRRQALRRAGLRQGMRVLDVACGTGALMRAAADLVGSASIVGCDPSGGMLALAARKIKNATFIQASAERLPLASASFDFVSMGYGLRHVEDLGATFGEYARVLTPGGRLLILEITKPGARWQTALARLFFGRVAPMLGAIVTGDRAAATLVRYFWETIDACVPPHAILDCLANAGFTDVQRHVELDIFSEYTALKPAG